MAKYHHLVEPNVTQMLWHIHGGSRTGPHVDYVGEYNL